MSGVVVAEGEPTRIEVSSVPWEQVPCVCHGVLRIVREEDYPLNLHGRSWIIAGLYVSRCSVVPNNEDEVFQDPKGVEEAMKKIFEIAYPERANWITY